MVIEVVRSENSLSEQVWKFVMIDNAMVIEAYQVRTRPTLRHKLKVSEFWQRLMHLGEHRHAVPLYEANVPLPADVVAEVREECMKQLRVGFLSQIRGGK